MDMVPLDTPQAEYKVPALETIPDTDEDQPVSGQALVSLPSMISLFS